MHRVITLGLDGADLRYIEPLAKSGELPHFRRLMQEGAYGPLKSTIIPLTAVAWPSLYTGRNPGKTGMVDSTAGIRFVSETRRNIPINLVGFDSVPIWEYINQAGGEVVVFNNPVTYPPEPVDGILISGFDTPGTAAQVSHPKDLLETLQAEGIEYDLFDMQRNVPHDTSISTPTYVQMCRNVIERHTKLIVHFMQTRDWRFLMTTNHMTDYINHKTNQREAIDEVYRAADEMIGQVLDTLPPDAHLLIVSDHGTQPIAKSVNLGKVFVDAGLTVFTKPDELIEEPLLRTLRKLATVFRRDMPDDDLISAWQRLPRPVRRLFSQAFMSRYPGTYWDYENIDWSKTKAYALSQMGPIYINLKGRDPYGIVEPGEEYEHLRDYIIDQLTSLRDPQNGNPIFPAVHRTEELWSGPYMDIAPDLCWEWNSDGYVVSRRHWKDELVSDFEDGGSHAPNGILFIYGSSVQSGAHTPETDIIDVAPTALHLMGLPVSSDMDGRVLTRLLSEEYTKENPIVVQQEETRPTRRRERDYTEEELASVEGLLRGLGYIE